MKNSIVVLAIVLLVALVFVFAGGMGMIGMGGFGMGPGMMNGYGGYGGMMGGYGFNPLGAILSLVFWGLAIGAIVFGIVWLVRNDGSGRPHAGTSESPLDILNVRYAKGEITKEQYEMIKRDLKG